MWLQRNCMLALVHASGVGPGRVCRLLSSGHLVGGGQVGALEGIEGLLVSSSHFFEL